MAPLPALLEHDPTELGWPAALPLELAAKTAPIQTICERYGIDRVRWSELRSNPLFQSACQEALRVVSEPGGAFKGKITTMAEALLPRFYQLATHGDLDAVPASVQASIIRDTIRIAGLDASVEQKAKASANGGGVQGNFAINIHLR